MIRLFIIYIKDVNIFDIFEVVYEINEVLDFK